jgi:DNA (cytosine-5)-methyltransferase 1
MNHLSLFTGIGGIDLAAEWAGFQTVGQCEWADYPTKVLEKHWPNVPRWRDVRDVTADSVRAAGIERVDLLSGGFPCQPHSVAGKRRASNDERDLWPELARVIGELKPRWFLGENVPGLLTSEAGRFFGRVLRDLATLGYRVGWIVYGAKDVGAPHRRERVFIVAYSNCIGRNDRSHHREKRQVHHDIERNTTEGQSEWHGWLSGIGSTGSTVADTTGEGLERRERSEFKRSGIRLANGYEATGRTTQSRLGGAANGIPYRMDDHHWPAGFGQAQYDWEPPRVAQGIKHRADRLKCLGNAVVPQQVYPILKAIAEAIKREGSR